MTARVVTPKTLHVLSAPDRSIGVTAVAAMCLPVFFVRSRSSRALALSGVGEKGGARLLGRAAVRPFYNTINDLKNRLRMLRERGGSLAELPRPPAY
jgi:hypothetical protein